MWYLDWPQEVWRWGVPFPRESSSPGLGVAGVGTQRRPLGPGVASGFPVTGPPATAPSLPCCADAGPLRHGHGHHLEWPGGAYRLGVQSRLRVPLPLLRFLLAGPPGATGALWEGLPIVTLWLLSTQTLTSDLVL